MSIDKYTDATLHKYAEAAEQLGYDQAARKLGIKKESLRRGVREFKRRLAPSGTQKPIDDNVIRQLKERYTDEELHTIARGGHTSAGIEAPVHNFEGDEITIGVVTDTHHGSTFSDPERIYEMFDVFAKVDVDMIVHCGDVFEGLSSRAGHVYELTHIGYSAQLDHGVEIWGRWANTPVYMIDGNHDRWYLKSAGAMIVPQLCEALDNLTFLGHDEGDIVLRDGENPTTLKLWHGEDGSSYAISYRIQKLVEAFTGGAKPNALVCGHTHKAMYVYDRHIHCISAGSMQRQSRWMRSKRHASHTGFWILRLCLNDIGITWIEPRWYPLYV